MSTSADSSSRRSQLPVVFSSVAAVVVCRGFMFPPSSAIAQSLPDATAAKAPFTHVPLSSDHPSEPTAIEPIAITRSSSSGISFELEGLETNPTGAALSTVPPLPKLSNVLTVPSESAKSSLDLKVPATTAPNDANVLPPSLANLFIGDTHSLAAIAIGCAEGTRTPDGGKTWAFKGHRDPGNGVWNLGTFSWQHGASSPEEADRKQLARLKKQAVLLNQQAVAMGVPWGLNEQLNALDLANQSPSAALNPGGYMERLKQAHDDGLRGTKAILWARTWSYRHPSGTRWNAPGLGNTHHGIRTDQKRRMDEIEQAIAASSTRSSQTTPAPPRSPQQAENPTHAPTSHGSTSKQQKTKQQERNQRIQEQNILERLITIDL